MLRNVTIGLYEAGADERALAVLDEVGLKDRRATPGPRRCPAVRLSGSSLARALVTEPDLVLLDEPFAALDAITRLRMHDLVRELRHRHNAAMLLVTHDVDEAIALADRILVMSDGRIGSTYDVRLDEDERDVGAAREDLRASLLGDLGLAAVH